MRRRPFRPGDTVVFRMTKISTRPGPRAEEIHPAPHGEWYTYKVDKFWVVVEAHDDGKLLVQTRRGKQHLIDADSPQLRHARWWERLLFGQRFPKLTAHPAAN